MYVSWHGMQTVHKIDWKFYKISNSILHHVSTSAQQSTSSNNTCTMYTHVQIRIIEHTCIKSTSNIYKCTLRGEIPISNASSMDLITLCHPFLREINSNFCGISVSRLMFKPCRPLSYSWWSLWDNVKPLVVIVTASTPGNDANEPVIIFIIILWKTISLLFLPRG